MIDEKNKIYLITKIMTENLQLEDFGGTIFFGSICGTI